MIRTCRLWDICEIVKSCRWRYRDCASLGVQESVKNTGSHIMMNILPVELYGLIRVLKLKHVCSIKMTKMLQEHFGKPWHCDLPFIIFVFFPPWQLFAAL